MGAFGCSKAIHLLEAIVSVLAISYAFSDPHAWARTIVTLGDNMSVLLACDGRRAGDSALSTVVQHSAAMLFATDCVWRRRHVESSRRPTDADSRLVGQGLLAQGQRIEGPHLQRYLSSRKDYGGQLSHRSPPGRAFLQIGRTGDGTTYSLQNAGLRTAIPLLLTCSAMFDPCNPDLGRLLAFWLSSDALWGVWIDLDGAGGRRYAGYLAGISAVLRILRRYAEGLRVLVFVSGPRGSKLWSQFSLARQLGKFGRALNT